MNWKIALIGCLLALLFLGCTQHPTTQHPTASEVFNHMQQKYDSIKSYKAKIHQKEISGKKTAETDLLVYFKKPDEYRIEYPSKGVVSVVADGVFWSHNKKELKVKEFNATFTDFPFGFLLKEMEKYDISFAGEEKVNGKECYVLELKAKGENPLLLQKVWVVKGEWYPARVQSRLTVPQEFLIAKSINETSIWDIRMDFNVKISEDLFRIQTTPVQTNQTPAPQPHQTETKTEETPEPLTLVEYPGSEKVYIPRANESLPSLPYHAYNLTPKPGSKASLDTVISVSYPRPPAYLKLEIDPEVKISRVKKEMIFYSARFTFYLAEPLKPGTEYKVTVIAGQYDAPPGFKPYAKRSWNFTTVNPEIDIVPLKKYLRCRNNESKIMLEDAWIEFVFLKREDLCPPTMEWYGAKPGDLGILLKGYLRSDYDRDYWTSLTAFAYNSKGEKVGGVLDGGHICGAIPISLKSKERSYFEVHLKYRDDIRVIKIVSGCVYTFPPP